MLRPLRTPDSPPPSASSEFDEPADSEYNLSVPKAARGDQLLSRDIFLVAALAVLYLAGLVPAASARDVYVTNNGPGENNVSVFETQGNQVVGSPTTVGGDPRAIAISPDGKTAYVANAEDGTVSVIDTQTDQVVGSPITVGTTPRAIAVSPNGQFAYVTNEGSNNVSVIDTQTDQVVGSPITVGSLPIPVAISPDGRTAYVANAGSGTVSVIDTETNEVVGAPITVGTDPHGIAITPDGRFAYVTNNGSSSVSVIDTQTDQVVGSPITVGTSPWGIAITPGGNFAYVANFSDHSVSVIDTHANQVVGSPISVGTSPIEIAITPDGRFLYVTNNGSSSVSVIDTQTDQVVGTPITVGLSPEGIAITPDQPPLASFAAPRARPGVPLAFSASTSSDPDGSIATYAWTFGDGQTATDGGPSPAHTYGAPGIYTATLALTDNEGCSSTLIFTGQTAFCNGSASASQTQNVTVAYPGVRLKCSKSASPKGCKFKVQVVSKKRKGKPESAVAKAKATAGHSVIVSLKPKVAFRDKLAVAKNVLVKETVKTKGPERTRFRKLKIVQ